MRQMTISSTTKSPSHYHKGRLYCTDEQCVLPVNTILSGVFLMSAILCFQTRMIDMLLKMQSVHTLNDEKSQSNPVESHPVTHQKNSLT